MKKYWFVISLWATFAAQGQTLIDLRTQTKSPDFSAMTGTKPIQVGTTLPNTCTVGQLFYSTSSKAGTNLYGCTAANTWSVLGAGNGTATGGTGTASLGQVLYNSNNAIGGLTVGNVCVTVSGSTLDVNTALCPTRQMAAEALDTTCIINSGSSSAYLGATLGNAITAYAQGMRLLTQVDVTTAGGTITLDCGAGAKPLYGNDGVSNPNPSQWQAGVQVLVSYDGTLNSGAGGWRILSGGSSSTSGSGSSGVSPTPVSLVWSSPFGTMTASSVTQAVSSGETRFIEVAVPYPGALVSSISIWVSNNTGHIAFALYSSSCSLIAGSSATIVSGAATSVTFPGISLPPGKAFIAYSADNTATIFAATGDNGYVGAVSNNGESSGNYHIFDGGTTTWLAGVPTFPSTCGSRIALSSYPYSYVPGMTIH